MNARHSLTVNHAALTDVLISHERPEFRSPKCRTAGRNPPPRGVAIKEQTTVIISDFQAPYEARRALANVIQFVADFRPDVLVNIGDDADAPEPAFWSRGSALEYAGTFQKGLDKTREIHSAFRRAHGGLYQVSRSNHTDRIRRYVARYAPALLSLRSLDVSTLLGYDELEIEYMPRPWSIAPGWTACHGDEGKLSPYAGRTAANLAKRWGTSVVCGHTHRAGIAPASEGFNGRTRMRVGMEVGHLMDVRQASYLKGGHADWQMAFGILYRRGSRVQPELVFVQPDGSFCVGGQWYPRASESSPLRVVGRAA